jgi:HSP20 family protein
MAVTRSERRGKSDIDDIFSMFDAEFEEMRERMDQLMGSMLAGQFSTDEESSVYGISMQIGSNGTPRMKEFGNVRQTEPAEETQISEEPLMDVLTEKDKVRVILALPGMQMEDISVNVAEGRLSIVADSEHRKFSKDIELPCPIRKDGMLTNFKNGVLEIKMDREPPKRRKRKAPAP